MDPTAILTAIDSFFDKEHGVGAASDQIVIAERTLGVSFPDSYRYFLAKLGWCRFAHEELYGLGSDVPPHLDLVRNTIAERTVNATYNAVKSHSHHE